MPPFSDAVNPTAPADAVCEGTMDEEAEVELEEVVVAEEANVEEVELVTLNNGIGGDEALAPTPIKEGVALWGSGGRLVRDFALCKNISKLLFVPVGMALIAPTIPAVQ